MPNFVSKIFAFPDNPGDLFGVDANETRRIMSGLEFIAGLKRDLVRWQLEIKNTKGLGNYSNHLLTTTVTRCVSENSTILESLTRFF